MSLGAGTIVGTGGPGTQGPINIQDVRFAGDSSYPTGGTAAFQAFIRTLLAQGNVEICGIVHNDCAGYFPVYDKVADKLKVYWCGGSGAAMSEVTSATNLSSATFNLSLILK